MVWVLSVGVSAMVAAPFYALARWKHPPEPRNEAAWIAGIVFAALLGLATLHNLTA